MNYPKTIFCCICILACLKSAAQVDADEVKLDSLERVLSGKRPDTGQVEMPNARSKKLNKLADFKNALRQATESLSKKTRSKKGEGAAETRKDSRTSKLFKTIVGLIDGSKSSSYNDSAIDEQRDNSEALKELDASLKVHENQGDVNGVAEIYNSIGEIYSREGRLNEALEKHSAALKIIEQQGKPGGDNTSKKDAVAQSYLALGNINIKLDNFPEAKQYLQKGLQISKELNDKSSLSDVYRNLSFLDDRQGNYKEAYEYYKLYVLYRDSVDNIEISKKFTQAQLKHDYEIREANAKAAQAKKDAESRRTRNVQYLIIVSLALIIIAATVMVFIQHRNNKEKQKTNLLLQLEKEKVEGTLSELQSTQAQLIQSEKMASLGELTAGIAHEIQNPLNFVNNFSEVNKELLLELKEEIDNGNITEVKIIADDVIDNQEKINYHGKRADAIVKGMLQHSRATTGQKEPTDINALADEYLRLSYHGMRAKDKAFNAAIHTDFDESIGKINIIPQDIGRVLLNLLNNAFYASHHASLHTAQQAGAHYTHELPADNKPAITVTTKKRGKMVEIRVKDNGNGIPQPVLEKIFQPFFTTKPTGEGTGLGLSLSYDVIKAHGGEIKVETGEAKGATFIVQLPIG